MSRFRSTFVLVLVFVAFFSYFWVYQKDKKAPDASPSPMDTPASVQLTALKADDIAEISWKSASYSATIQNPGDQKWRLIQPPLPSDEAKLKSYVDSSISLTGTRKYTSGQLSVADSGLDNPALVLTIKLKNSTSTVVKIGKKTIDGDYYYARKDGEDEITLIGSYVVDDLNKDPASFKPDPSASPVASGSSSGSGFTPAGSTTPQN